MRISRNRHASVISALLPCWLAGAAFLSSQAQLPFGPPLDLPPLSERKAVVLEQFDKDSDGLLSESERSEARLAWAAEMLRKREPGFFRPPPEVMEEFDTNQDGELDDEEERKLREVMGRRFEKLGKDYDQNGNGRLDEDEIDTAAKDIDAGKLKGIPRMFLQFARGGPRGGRRGGGGPGGPGSAPGESADVLDPAEIVQAADKDGDGRLNAAELAAVREAWAKRRAAKLRAEQKP